MNNGDGLAIGWLGHAIFLDRDNSELFVRRMPTFFETFPVLLLDNNGVVRADIPFRRAESKYSIEQVGVSVSFFGGELDGLTFTDPVTVKVGIYMIFQYYYASFYFCFPPFYVIFAMKIREDFLYKCFLFLSCLTTLICELKQGIAV